MACYVRNEILTKFNLDFPKDILKIHLINLRYFVNNPKIFSKYSFFNQRWIVMQEIRSWTNLIFDFPKDILKINFESPLVMLKKSNLLLAVLYLWEINLKLKTNCTNVFRRPKLALKTPYLQLLDHPGL